VIKNLIDDYLVADVQARDHCSRSKPSSHSRSFRSATFPESASRINQAAPRGSAQKKLAILQQFDSNCLD
jgi:hypothetical protein